MNSPSAARSLADESPQQTLAEDLGQQIDRATGILPLLEVIRAIIGGLLKRAGDQVHRDKMLVTVTRYFMTTMNTIGTPADEKLANLKLFSREIVAVIVAERALIAAPPPAEAAAGPEQRRRAVDLQPGLVADTPPVRLMALHGLGEALPDAAAAPAAANDPQPAVTAEDPQPAVPADGGVLSAEVDPTAIAVAAPRPPRSFPGFAELFPAAICYRVERVVTFFHRYNRRVDRVMPRPFLLSPVFADRLYDTITSIIVPRMVESSRNIALLATSHSWAGIDTAEFWRIVDSGGRFGTGITAAWTAAWDDCRQSTSLRKGKDGKTITVLTASPVLLRIREKLAPGGHEYLIPPVRNRELDLFSALLFDFDVDRLEFTWTRLRQLYEQELDRRAYQDKARVGAFRDSMLDAFELVPDLSGDFLAMLCYFCFPNCDITFLDRFTRNKGSTPVERRARIPYLMEFLVVDGVEAARRRETGERKEREALCKPPIA